MRARLCQFARMVNPVSRDSNPRTPLDKSGQSSNFSGLRYSEWTIKDKRGRRVAPKMPQWSMLCVDHGNFNRDMPGPLSSRFYFIDAITSLGADANHVTRLPDSMPIATPSQ